MSLRDLRTIGVIAREGSLTAAGTRLGFSQATISGHLASAEAALGVTLFRRHGRGVELTAAGRAVVRHAENVFATLTALRADARSAQVPSVTIGASEPAASRRVVPFIRSADRRVPGRELHLRVAVASDLNALVERGELEVAVTSPRRELSRGTEFTPLYEQELVLLVPERHRLAGAREADLGDLHDDRLLVGEDTCIYRCVIQETIAAADVEVALRARIGALTTLPHGVAGGLGIAILPRELVEPPPAQTVVVPLRTPIRLTIGVLVRTDASDAARAVAEELIVHATGPVHA
ncbi:MAG: LysR family transcriptional regulator [Vulcanimicrobiaceae bacterium]